MEEIMNEYPNVFFHDFTLLDSIGGYDDARGWRDGMHMNETNLNFLIDASLNTINDAYNLSLQNRTSLTKTKLLSPRITTNNNTPKYIWKNINGATSYELTVDSLDNNENFFTVRVSSSNCIPKGKCFFHSPAKLEEGSYKYRIRAFNNNGGGSFSDWGSFIYGDSTLAAPSLLSPNGTIGSGNPIYKWPSVERATGYKLMVQNIKTKEIVVFEDISSIANCESDICTFAFHKALNLGEYRYRIRPYNPANRGTWTEWEPFTYGLPPPPVILGSELLYSENQGVLAWEMVRWATKYQIAVFPTTMRINPFLVEVDSKEVCENGICRFTPIQELTIGTYKLWINAFNDAGWGPYSTTHEINYIQK
jgi:hypothetical protein